MFAAELIGDFEPQLDGTFSNSVQNSSASFSFHGMREVTPGML